MSNYSIDVHLYMEKGMYARLVERGQELGLPLSAVVREAVVEYFENIPEVPEQGNVAPQPEDTIWQLPTLSATYGSLNTLDVNAGRANLQGGGR